MRIRRFLLLLLALLMIGAAAAFADGGTPELPKPKKVIFPKNQSYAVFSAPGKDSLRGAGGKAKVASGDWIEVYGMDGRYVMIRYEITPGHYRIGYIHKKHLPKGKTVKRLKFGTSLIDLPEAVAVTDDPESKAELIPAQTYKQARLLATLPDWNYIEVQTQNAKGDLVTARGFVPKQIQSTQETYADADAMRTVLPGTWAFEAGGEMEYHLFRLSPDGTYIARDFDDDAGLGLYDLLANPDAQSWASGEAQRGTWSVVPYDAGRGLYWNDPVAELVLTHAPSGLEQRYGLTVTRITDDADPDFAGRLQFSITTDEGGGGYVKIDAAG